MTDINNNGSTQQLNIHLDLPSLMTKSWGTCKKLTEIESGLLQNDDVP